MIVSIAVADGLKSRPPEPLVGAFGEKLRKQREQRGLALDAISNTTKISPRMLRALEEEHFDQLPGGVFNKGFVRAYARQVGLDEEEAVGDYLAALRESQIQQQSILPDFRTPAGKSSPAAAPDLRSIEPSSQSLRNHDLPGHDESAHTHALPGEDRRRETKEDRRHRQEYAPLSSASTTHAAATPPAQRSPKYPAGDTDHPAVESSARIPWGTLAAALLLVTLLLAFLNLRRHRDATAAPNPVTTSNQSPVQTPASASKPSGSGTSLTVGQASPAGTLSVGTPPAGTTSAGTPSPTLSAATTSSGPAPTLPGTSPSSKAATSSSPPGSATSKPAANPTAAATNAPPAKTTTHAPAVKPPPSFTLLIRAEKTTWVSIVADGKPVAEETLIAPAHTSIRASHEIYVRTGNAAGVSFLLNGKEFPAQGNDGEVKTYIFDATGPRVEPQPAAPNR
jgi:hypothetical protein